MLILKDLSFQDLPLFESYWYGSSPEYLASLGIDPAKLESREEFLAYYHKIIAENEALEISKIAYLVIHWQGKAVGYHNLTELKESESAVMHAHLWDPHLRGKGIGTKSYVLAADIFVRRFNLQEILFKTPTFNLAANRIKQKLGLVAEASIELNRPILREKLPATLYRLNRQHLKKLMADSI